MFSEDFETDFGLKQSGGAYEKDCWNLIEEYWFLDSFGADFGFREYGL